VDSAAFADKDFKLLTAEFGGEDEPEPDMPDASEDTPGESPEENKEA
jgi:hypothetical protein